MTDQLPADDVLKRIQGLLNLAAKNSQPEEAASAAAKAQELLARHNLDAATVENHAAIKDGKREQAAVDGGAYAWQRELWRAVAELNFCLYWTQTEEVFDKRRIMRNPHTGIRQLRPGYVDRRRHALVGRIVNTRATVALAGYLQQAVERCLLKRLHGDANEKNLQRFSSWAADYRNGATRRIVEKVRERRSELVAAQRAAAEARARAGAERAASDASSGTALTISNVVESEHDENVDFMYGEGTSARWAAERAENARLRRLEHEAAVRWARENPVEAAARAAKDRETLRRQRVSSGPRDRGVKNPGAYWDGYDAADAIGLDGQVAGTRVAGRLR